MPLNERKERLISFSHGKESGPDGIKIQHLSKVAEKHGYESERIDYRGIESPDDRVAKLLSIAKNKRFTILVGSSMGAYVAAVASNTIKPAGLFLMAPAINLPGYAIQNPEMCGCTHVVHGWDDEIIPASSVYEWARRLKVQLTLVESDHQLHSALPVIEKLFGDFLYMIEENLKKENIL